MSNTIKLKRGSGSDPTASDLAVGEVALRTDNASLFTKKDDGNVAEIGAAAGVSDGDKGDITVSNGGSTFTIDSGVVNNAKVASNAAIAGSKISPSFTSDITITNTSPQLFLVDSNNNSDYSVENEDGTFRVVDTTNSAARLTINSSGTATFSGNLDVGSGVDVTGAITSTGKVQAGDDVEVVVSSGDAFILTKGGTNQGHLVKKADNTTVAGLTNGGAVSGSVNDAAVFAPAGDLKLIAGGSNVNSNLIVDVTSSGIDVTGNIAVSGTVDGVDIAARNTLFGGLTSSSGVLTNGVTATTQSASDNSTKVATTAYTDTAIANLVDSAPGTLNTLNELAAALGDDANFSTTVTNSIATKMPLAGGTFTGDVLFQCDSGNILFDKSDNAFEFSDGVKAKFGGSSDLQIFHDGTDNIITTNNSKILQLRCNGTEKAIEINPDGNVELYFNNNIKFQTESFGATVSGGLDVNTGSVKVLTDGYKFEAGASGDLQMYHSGSDSFIDETGAGDLKIRTTNGNGIQLISGTSENMITCASDGSVELYEDGTKRIETTTSGANIVGNLTLSGTVDGRDVASDGSKLDGIESGATADQSASEILTLIKTVDGSGSGLDADLLDGVSSGSFVRSDANDSITGHLTITNDSGLKVRSSTNGAGAVINFSDHTGGSYAQNGSLTYKHGDGEVTTTGGNSNDGWLFEGTETRTVVKVVGDLEATQDIYGGTLVLNDSDNQKIILQGSNDPYIRWREGTTNKAYIQWSSSGYLWLANQEDNSVIVLRDNLGFSPDGGSTIHSIFHAGNDGPGSGLDADTLDGQQGSHYLNYNNFSNTPTIPTNNNQLTNGAGYITSASFSDVAGGGTFTGDIALSGGAAAMTVNAGSDIRFTNGDWTGNTTKIQHHANYLYIVGGSNGIIFREGGNDRAIIDPSGHLIPGANNTYRLGSPTVRWQDVYTNDLNLSNEGGSNKVDNTWGDYTIQEGADDLFIINNRNGKMFKFMLQEVK